MVNTKDIKYLIFSFSGVLYQGKSIEKDGEEADLRLIQQAYQKYGILPTPTREAIMPKIEEGLRAATIFEQLNAPHAEQLFGRYNDFLDQTKIERMELTHNAKKLLVKLQEAGIKVIIVDFLTPDIVRKGIRKLGIEPYIDSVINTEPSGELRKGQPKVFNLIQETYPDMTSANTAVVGHQNADLNFANAVQLDSFWIQNAGGDFKMCQHLPTYTIRSLAHLSRKLLGQSLEAEEQQTLTSRP